MKKSVALRRLVAASAGAAVVATGVMFAPISASAEPPGPVSYDAPPDATQVFAPVADPLGAIPCVGASDAVFASLGCSGRVVARYDLADDLAPSLVSSSRAYNCAPGPVGPATDTITVTNTTSVGVTTGSATGSNGATWISNGGSGGGGGGFSLFGLISFEAKGEYQHTQTEVTGWTHEESSSLGQTFSVQDSRTLRVPAYSWGFMAFKPQYKQVEVEWAWKDPTNSGARRTGTQVVRIPKTTTRTVTVGGESKQITVPQGDWDPKTIAMTPAEIEACQTKGRPAFPTFDQPSVAVLDRGHTLDTVPFLFAANEPGRSIERVGTSITVPSDRPQTVPLATKSEFGTITAVETVNHALLMPGPSSAGFWLGGSCTAFTARIGYGYDRIWDQPELTRDTLEVWSARVERGVVVPAEKLSSTLVPALPPLASGGADKLQAAVDVALPAGTDVLMLKVVTSGGPVRLDADSKVVLAEPRIQCGDSGREAALFQRSVYADPVSAVTVDLAGTPDEVTKTVPVDGKLFMQPTHVEYGWKPSADAPNSGCPNQPEAARTSASALPQTTVNFSCGMQPLRVAGKTYDSGVGFHSNGSVTWENTRPTCTRVEMGIGFDDSVSYQWRAEHTATLEIDGVVVQTRTLRKDGSSGVQWFSAPLALGPHTIRVTATSAGENYEGHVDVVSPELTCQYQGSRTEMPDSPSYRATGLKPLAVSGMRFLESTNGWGPVEVNTSLGESAAGDGRAITIQGRTGWASGLGVAPGGNGAVSRVTVATGGSCSQFSAWVGVDDEIDGHGSVEFQVWVDGKPAPVAKSGVLTGSDGARFLWADVSGAQTVSLVVTDGGIDSNAWDHADWAEPTLYCS